MFRVNFEQKLVNICYSHTFFFQKRFPQNLLFLHGKSINSKIYLPISMKMCTFYAMFMINEMIKELFDILFSFQEIWRLGGKNELKPFINEHNTKKKHTNFKNSPYQFIHCSQVCQISSHLKQSCRSR